MHERLHCLQHVNQVVSDETAGFRKKTWNSVVSYIIQLEGEKNKDVVGAQLREYLKGCEGNIKTWRNIWKTFTIVWPCIVINSLWIKPIDALNSNFIGITTLHVSGSLSAHHQEFLAVHRRWYILCSFDDCCYQLVTVCWAGMLQIMSRPQAYTCNSVKTASKAF